MNNDKKFTENIQRSLTFMFTATKFPKQCNCDISTEP